MEQYCALCGKYIHRTEDPIRGKDGRIYHAHCYSRVKDKLEKDYEKKGFVSKIKRSFRQPEAYLSEQTQQEKLYAITGGPEYGWHVVTLGTDGKWYNFFGNKPMNRSALDKAIENVTKMGFSKIDDWDPRHPELIDEVKQVYKSLLKEALLIEGIQGKSFCITGTLSIPRAEMWRQIEDSGGVVHKSVTRSTDFLIIGSDIGRNKIAKAQSLGIKTMTERELYNMMKGRGRPSTRELTAHRGSGRYLGTERIGKLRGRGYNYGEKEPSYLDLAGLTSESRELMKKLTSEKPDKDTIDTMLQELDLLDTEIQFCEDEGFATKQLKNKWRVLQRKLDAIFEKYPDLLDESRELMNLLLKERDYY